MDDLQDSSHKVQKKKYKETICVQFQLLNANAFQNNMNNIFLLKTNLFLLVS